MASRRSRPELQPTKIGRGQGKYWDPFYQFEQLARYHGEPPKPPEPSKRAVLLVRVLTSKTLAIVLGVVLAAAVLVLLVLLVFRG